uniref:Uncharacterized protein n=1 Tax=Glossina pallidipes TaxID=7398 RepID=A0A1B0AAN3_GLOPL
MKRNSGAFIRHLLCLNVSNDADADADADAYAEMLMLTLMLLYRLEMYVYYISMYVYMYTNCALVFLAAGTAALAAVAIIVNRTAGTARNDINIENTKRKFDFYVSVTSSNATGVE